MDLTPPPHPSKPRPSSAPSGAGPQHCSTDSRIGIGGMTVHEASRAKKAVESNVKAVENRIRYFQREEAKIWRDLEEVRRQAATIEEGRTRGLEKKLADRAIQEQREQYFRMNQARAAATRTHGAEQRRRNQTLQERDKKIAGEEQRRISQDILRQKRMQEAQARLENSERAVAIQRAQLESKLRVNQDKQTRIERLREQHEAERIAAEMEVQEAETILPQLEAEEMACLQRLQNSRIVEKSVLEELETSLGKQSAVTSLLRAKQRSAEHCYASFSAGGLSAGDVNSPCSPQEPGLAAK